MRDLELRGAGNILGMKQSGHIAGVGFELYCQLLRQSIAGLKGENPIKIFRAEIRLDFVRFSNLPESGAKDMRNEYQILKDEKNAAHLGDVIVATLPADYISDVRVRIDTFRRLAMAGTPDEVRVVQESMEDRFGKLPPEARAFCMIAELRCVAEAHGIVELETEAGTIRARRRRGDFVKIGVNFPRLSSLDSIKRLRELRDFLLRQ
jgi:transcription-repair coupling factor (superfamily II helicase)